MAALQPAAGVVLVVEQHIDERIVAPGKRGLRVDEPGAQAAGVDGHADRRPARAGLGGRAGLAAQDEAGVPTRSSIRRMRCEPAEGVT